MAKIGQSVGVSPTTVKNILSNGRPETVIAIDPASDDESKGVVGTVVDGEVVKVESVEDAIAAEVIDDMNIAPPVVKRETHPEPAPAVPATPMQLLELAVTKGDFDVDALGKLMDLQERHQANIAHIEFNDAMAKFQAECPAITMDKSVMNKGGQTVRYRYASLEHVMGTIQGHMQACGLSVRVDTRTDKDGYLTAICYVTHVGGHTEQSEFTCPMMDDVKSSAGKSLMNAPQRMASINSYAKRYAIANALFLTFVDEDDDGQEAGVQTITADEAIQIRDLINEKQVDHQAFLAWVNVKSFEDIPASWYDRILKEYGDD